MPPEVFATPHFRLFFFRYYCLLIYDRQKAICRKDEIRKIIIAKEAKLNKTDLIAIYFSDLISLIDDCRGIEEVKGIPG